MFLVDCFRSHLFPKARLDMVRAVCLLAIGRMDHSARNHKNRIEMNTFLVVNTVKMMGK